MNQPILADAKVGDVLCVTERLVGPAPDVLRRAIVTKTTPTRVHVGRNGHTYTFDRHGNERPAPRYSLGMTACPMTPALESAITRQNCVLRARRTVRDLASKALTDGQAIEIASAIIKALEVKE